MSAIVSARAAPATFLAAFLVRAQHSPDAAFLTDPDGAGLTYQDVADRAATILGALRRNGVGPGDRVGLYLPNTPAWVVASVAVWSAGASLTAAGTLVSPLEAGRAFDLSGVAAVVAMAADVRLSAPVLEVDALGSLRDAGPAAPLQDHADADAEAVVFFTSGTTGAAKGVPHRHVDLIRWARQVADAYAESGEFRETTAPARVAPGVIFTPFGHIGGYLSLAFRLWIGRAVVLVQKFSVEMVSRLLQRYPLRALQLTPTMIQMLAQAEVDPGLSRLDYVTSSTAPLSPATRERFEGRYGTPVLQAYGMTEVGTIAQERYGDVATGRRPANSVGRAASGVRIRIVDADGLDRPPGAEGEIVVASETAALGYLGTDAGCATDGWLRTGDIGRLDGDGFLFITSRLSDRIIVGGFNVYPAEVEDALRASALVADAGVVGVPDERLGECPVAAIVWRDQPEPEALREEVRARLAHYKVPRSWIGVPAIPQTDRGKVDRVRLGELVAEMGR